MKTINTSSGTRPLSASAFALMLALVASGPASAEDLDLFTGAAGDQENPNVLIIIDNSANWSSASQQWPGGFKQGQSELRALRTVAGELNDKINFGMMMFTEGSGSNAAGGYVRFHVRQMTDVNKKAFQELIGDDTCILGSKNSLNLTPNCIYKNFDTATEKTGTSKTNYSATLFEAFKYLGGYTSPALAHSDTAGSPVDLVAGPAATHFGGVRYAGDPDTKSDFAAFVDGGSGARNTYISPIAELSCAKNYVIFIGNGFPVQDLAEGVLKGVGGNSTQMSMPVLSTQNVTEPVGSSCGTDSNETKRLAACTAGIPLSLTEEFAHHTNFQCKAGTGVIDVVSCGAHPNARKYTVEATRPNVVTQTDQSQVPTSDARFGDEWAKFLFTTDVNEAVGQQNVKVHTIDVFNKAQDARQTSLLFNMAKAGGGSYYQASNEQEILNAIRQILIEIQSLNSVFASASLPINATNRSQNENQVFIGMFRPDAGASPRWFGNLKRYQIGLFGSEAKLADMKGLDAVSEESGFIQPCATSFWTTDSGTYWDFLQDNAGTCTSAPTSVFSDLPDGPNVEKGAVAEIIRKGNNPPTTDESPTFAVNRSVYTCANDGVDVKCKFNEAMDVLDTTTVTQDAFGVFFAEDHEKLVKFVQGEDVDDENRTSKDGDNGAGFKDVRPSIHGDVAHSRPLPVNYLSHGVVVFYGSNDGAFRAVRGSDGKELWAFVAPEHHTRFDRLMRQEPKILYPSMVEPFPVPQPLAKDYFFDGSAGLFQTAKDENVWVFPSMRRGGRMLYGFDVTNPTAPMMKWRVGCTDPSMADTTSCTSGFEQMGQTWSTPAVALVKGYSADKPVIIVGAGYDSCEDQDAAPNTECKPETRRGNRVYVIDAATGVRLAELATNGSVPADVTLVDRDFDSYADHAYVADTTGRLYRIDFVDPFSVSTTLAADKWTITEVARVTSDNRKFLFSPAALPAADKVYLAIASGDRERPLLENYPFPTTTNPGVLNRGYMVIDKFSKSGTPIDLDGSSMEDMSAGSSCPTPTDNPEARGSDGWYINLNAASSDPKLNVGEQAVTSTIIFGGLVFFSTNRPEVPKKGVCSNNLGEARGYALNLLNASGAADTQNVCGGARSAEFLGGGLPPSPVTGTVPVGGKPVTIMIGGVQRTGGVSSPIGAQRVSPSITQRRSRVYWYTDGDK